MKHPLRRGLVATAVAALGAGLIAPAPAAQAAPSGPSSYAYSAARWLEDQLTDGLVHDERYDVDDVGLTIDVFFTLHDLGTRADAQTRIVDALASRVDSYTTGADFGAPDDRYAGAVGKLASAVQAAGKDARAFGGVDVIQRAEELVVTDGAANGRAQDRSAYGDSSNAIGQAWVVRALVTAKSDRARSTVDYLLKQQCADGGFRIKMSDGQCTTPAQGEEPTVDATAFAVQALDLAEEQGVTGLDDDVADATAWLLRQQAADGSFGADGAANTNSTGLAAAALLRVGQTGAAGSAASWIVGKQVTDAVAEDSALRHEIGAIAFNQQALERGLREGITVDTRDQWIRASAQAAAGVDAQLSATKASVSGPTGYVVGGKAVTVKVAGFGPREKVRVSVAGRTALTTTAGADGRATASVTPVSRTRTIAVTAVGSRPSRVGAANLKVLAAKARLGVRLSRPKVARGGRVRVVAKGLAPGEVARVSYRGHQVATGTASSKGTYSTVIRVGRSTGSKAVLVRGLVTTRQGKVTLRVRR